MLVLVIACVFLVPKLIGTARYDAAILRFPFQVDDAEGVLIAEAKLIADGTNPYAFQPSPASYFYAGPYTPFYTLLNSGAMGLTGPTFKFGRAVQLAATLGVAAWLGWAVRRALPDGRGWLLGGWTATLFFTAHLVTVWSVRVRPDMTALLWNLLGVAVLRAALESSGPPRWRDSPWPRGAALGRLALGAACFALGWWTKQTFIAVPLACLLVATRRATKSRPDGGGLLRRDGPPTAHAPHRADGGGFAQKIIGYQGSWEWVAFRRLAQPFAERYGILLSLAIVLGVTLVLRARRPTFGVCWFAISAVLVLGAGTSGGNHNHFVELLAATALVIGQGLAALWTVGVGDRAARGQSRLAIAAVILALIVSTGVAVTEREGATGWLARDYRPPSVSERQGLTNVAGFVANSPGPVYSNNVGILVVTGQTVRVTDPFTMAAEVRLGRWDDASLVADVAAGRYPAIVLSYLVETLDPALPPTDATPGLIRAIQTRYHLVEKNVLNIYVPN